MASAVPNAAGSFTQDPRCCVLAHCPWHFWKVPVVVQKSQHVTMLAPAHLFSSPCGGHFLCLLPPY